MAVSGEETVARESGVHARGQDSGMAIDYEKVLSLSINGITVEIKEHKKTALHEQILFYGRVFDLLWTQ